jgi:glutamate synthase domain-containing protein 2
MLDREHTLEIKLARAHGNGAGLRLEPEDVVALVQRLRERKPRVDAASPRDMAAIAFGDGSER